MTLERFWVVTLRICSALCIGLYLWIWLFDNKEVLATVFALLAVILFLGSFLETSSQKIFVFAPIVWILIIGMILTFVVLFFGTLKIPPQIVTFFVILGIVVAIISVALFLLFIIARKTAKEEHNRVE